MAGRRGMSDLRRSLDDYLTLRRSLGYRLETVGRVLDGFVTFAEAAGAHTVTTELAVSWAKLPAAATPIWLAHRLSMVRGFARYLHTVDPATEIPPADLLPAGHYRPPTPYLYSDADIAALMAAARTLTPPLRAATFETLIGLLAVTGMRIGEAMRLDRDDIDWTSRLLTVHSSKFDRSRVVLCHDSTIQALRAYDRRRDQLCRHPTSPSFFVSTRGTRLVHATIYPAFRKLLQQAGLGQRFSSRRPRVHDFRHAFAVKTLLRWYRDGGDVEARMPLLSTYLGHVNPGSTYWYVSAAPELMALAAQRLEQEPEVGS
jgi:integrase/recombinase XerD